jgi:hypothetical protein
MSHIWANLEEIRGHREKMRTEHAHRLLNRDRTAQPRFASPKNVIGITPVASRRRLVSREQLLNRFRRGAYGEIVSEASPRRSKAAMNMIGLECAS